MDRARDEDTQSQVSEAGTITREALVPLSAGDHASDFPDDEWDLISERAGKTPDPYGSEANKLKKYESDLLMESYASLDADDDQPQPSSEPAPLKVPTIEEELFPNDQDDDEPFEESKSLNTDDEEDEDESDMKAARNKPNDVHLQSNTDDESSSRSAPQSPVVKEDYMMHSMLVVPSVLDLGGENEEVDRQPDERDQQGEDLMTLREAIGMSPPPEVVERSQRSANNCSIAACLDRLSASSRTGCEKVPGVSKVLSVASAVVLGLLLWTTFAPDRIQTCRRNSPKAVASSHIEVPFSFVHAFAREVSSCEGMCCFSLFILTGDASAHENAVKHAMRSSLRWKGTVDPKVDVWTAQRLVEWTEGRSEGDKEEVVLVKSADELETKQVQRVIRYGQRRCRESRRARPRIIVLSTSFGSDTLNDPDEVLSDTFVHDFKQRDWLAVPEIVLNRHGIIHGIRGKRPQRVFEDYLRAHKRESRPAQGQSIFSRLLFLVHEWWRSRTDVPLVQQSPVQFLDSWLEQKRAEFAWTESARRILISQAHQHRFASQIRAWLESQYAVWTKNGSCESVLFRSGRADVRAFNVACGPSVMTTTTFA